MIKQAIKGIAGFATGAALGAAAGVGVAYLTASKSGDDLRTDSQDLIASAKTAGAQAQFERETALRSKFRDQVGNNDALSTSVDETARSAAPTTSGVFASR